MNKNEINLTATEMSYLWSAYQSQSLNRCLLKYFDEIVEDEEIKKVNTQSLQHCVSYLEEIRTIFDAENFPIPIGFSVEEDVHLNATRLYTDPFILYFQWFFGKGNLTFGSVALNTLAREDAFTFFERFIREGVQTLRSSRELLLNKGLWIRSPYIPVPENVDTVKRESFFDGWIGEQRPLVGVEIANLFYNILTNSIGVALMNSFIQTTKNKELKAYLLRGKEIALKHIDVLSTSLQKEELPVPSAWNAGITDSNEAPFSDKLILNLVCLLNAQGVSNYGVAISTTMRRDLGLNFNRLSEEVLKYAEDGTEILIKYEWLESPPQAPRYNGK
ncbi:DUF3231 family protein [Bacillus alkalisoli]|uniref:DUF3231 family protein n=1 Tax=Bacillus alkalisoli TaxID=2011008 RepID=UPI000C24608F|nr:DUF3231 family protein [Bacillus alkalisoli]